MRLQHGIESNLEYNNKVYVSYVDYDSFWLCSLDQTNDDTAKHRNILERQEIDLEPIQ